jgi:hypothetical protein
MPTLPKLKHRITHRISTYISIHPNLYYKTRSFLGLKDELCINDATELVVEGAPRSANSATVSQFLEWQDKPVSVAHHKHHAAQLISAVQAGIPAVLLIRPPQDAWVSYLAMAEEDRLRTGCFGRGNALTFSDVGWSWLRFHEAVFPYLDGMVIAPFEVVVKDISPVIECVNARFGTQFQAQPRTNGVSHGFGWHAKPNPLRVDLKRQYKEGMQREMEHRSKLRALLEASTLIHERITARSCL